MARIKALSSLGTFIVLTLTSLSLLTGCGSIRTGAVEKDPGVTLTKNPKKVIIADFSIDNTVWHIGNETEGNFYSREGYDATVFKKDFQNNFSKILMDRLQKIAPTERRWVGALPNEGWLVTGEFIEVSQGSRALRTFPGFGAGETTLKTRVYVYDLKQSKTHYIFTFVTGVREDKRGGGAGSGESIGAFGEGLKLDSTRTAREIRDLLMTYAK